MLFKCCPPYVRKFGKLNSGHRTGKGQFSFISECSDYHIIVLISHSSKVVLKILHARFQQYVNQELPDVQAGFRRGRRTRDQIPNICWIMEKEGNSRKASASASLTMLKPLTVWITTNCGIFREMGVPDHLTISWGICLQFKKQQLELDMEQLVSSWERSMTRLHVVTLLI